MLHNNSSTRVQDKCEVFVVVDSIHWPIKNNAASKTCGTLHIQIWQCFHNHQRSFYTAASESKSKQNCNVSAEFCVLHEGARPQRMLLLCNAICSWHTWTGGGNDGDKKRPGESDRPGEPPKCSPAWVPGESLRKRIQHRLFATSLIINHIKQWPHAFCKACSRR